MTMIAPSQMTLMCSLLLSFTISSLRKEFTIAHNSLSFSWEDHLQEKLPYYHYTVAYIIRIVFTYKFHLLRERGGQEN